MTHHNLSRSNRVALPLQLPYHTISILQIDATWMGFGEQWNGKGT
ncbi:MAG: hypothetical protein RBJ76_03450 [Stenomitos frigidus ULC029]